jgi:glycosyltransferase involved in cell wall biosynthesis
MTTRLTKALAGDQPREAQPRGRVLIVVQNLPVPFDRRVWLEATTLAEAGYSVSVICPKMKGLNRSHEIIEDIEVYRYRLPFEARGAAGFIAEFIWCFLCTAGLSFRVALSGRGFDVLQVCNPPETYWPLGAFWRLFGKAFIFDHHDLSPEMFSAKFGRDKGTLVQALLFLERMTFRTAQIVLTTNESHRAIALSRGNKRPQDVYVVRSGPDFRRLRVMQRSPRWSQGRSFLVAYLGEICKQDGVEHLIGAMRVLHEEMGRDDIQCILIGGGPHQPEVVRYAEAIGMGECCTFTGSVSDETLCDILSSADLGVDPDPKNAWSDRSTMNKVLEYMFFGLPVVAYDLRETRVSAGDAGLYVEPNQERALAEGIARLLDDADRRAEMGRVGQLRVKETLAWNHSVPALLAAYDRVSPKRKRSGHIFDARGTDGIMP